MKICSKCEVEKPLDQFNKSARNKDGRHGYCRDCSKEHYTLNKTRHAANVRKNESLYLDKIYTYLVACMSDGCIDCGFKDIRLLEFDHVSGSKKDGVFQLVRRGFSLEVIIEEVAKCEVRCKHCHTLVTYRRLGGSWHDKYAPVMATPSKR